MESNKGTYLKLYRKIVNNPIFADPYLLKLFIYCLTKATYKEHEQIIGNQVIRLEKGQFVWGRFADTAKLNANASPKYSPTAKTWENKLKTLEKAQILTRKVTSKFTVVTIVNWGFYQSDEQQDYPQDFQQVTSSLPNDYQQITTNKKGNKDNKGNKGNQSFMNDDEDFKAIAQNFQKKIGVLNAINMQKLSQDFEKYGKYILWHAVEIGALKNATSYKYIERLLTDWEKRGLNDIESINEYLNNRDVNKKANYHNESIDYDSYYK